MFKIFKIIIGIIFLPILLLIYIISPIITIRLTQTPSSRIGHFVSEIEFYLCKKKLKKKKFFFPIELDIFFFDKVSNVFLAELIKRKITVLPTWILQPIYKIHTIFAERFKFLNIHTNFLGYNRDVFHYHKKLPTQLNLSAQDLKKGENYLKEKFGLNKNDKFVCITVRDNEYLKRISKYRFFLP